MTEGPHGRNDKPMCVRVWLEVGHRCEPRRSPLGRALAVDWRVWVRGARGGDISAYVHKVVFHLRPPTAFVYPKRVIQEPPYEIQESGCASIEIPIHVYFKYSSTPKRIRLRYQLQIESNADCGEETRCLWYDVENPSEQLWEALMRGGGQAVARAAPQSRVVVLVAGGGAAEPPPQPRKYEFIQPVDTPTKHSKKKCLPQVVDEKCSKCGESVTADIRRHLRSVEMTEDEIGRVAQLYAALSGYQRGEDALPLPAPCDPIYRVPELPAALRAALCSVEADHAML